QECIAAGIKGTLAAAIEKSNRIMAEDIVREAGYMLPQSANTHAFLEKLLLEQHKEGFPKEAVTKLLSLLDTEE
ncbi:MAG: rubrerythrin, partial [Oscillospiraceae bacterium]